ncbi:MAG: HD domain-containing protein [Candidatus Peribacteraceae bacterium]|nr:HD domain-containing protein [Candidatus Peribacteraceae bacterium]MBP9850343.1 HD domain-containing protein [Candidatus Peribacteraceae bacterium]
MQWQELRSHIRHLPARDIANIGEAFELGKKLHSTQKRRSGEPYFNHPIAVAHMLLALKADTDTIIAALLHDTVEDTPLTLEEIERDFGSGVAALIDGVTKLSSKDVAMSPKLDEQIETLRKIFTLMQQDVRIMVIKLVDRLHNMQTVEFLPPERQKLLAKETYEVFVKIADKLCMQDMRDELESLCLAVLEPETHAALLELRNSNEQRGTDLIEHIRTNVRAHDRILGSKIDLSFEPKTWDQVKAQLNVGGSVATGISFITVAFVCDDIDACYRMLGALHQLWKREALSFQDFINEPQLNGYRGLHTTIIAHDGTRVRCKIRTKEMHLYARSGITTKCFDSKAMGITEYLPWTKSLSSLAADTADSSDDFWENLKSDILGESIIIHGPGDSTVRLPRNATALDGAFFLFHDQALKTKSIKLNGVDVPFSSPLSNAASLDVGFDEAITCNRDWLRQTQTGFASAKIREVLMKTSDAQKLKTGEAMLQEVLTEQRRGFIVEFHEKQLAKQLTNLGYESLKDVYISIADGRLEPHDAYDALFRQKKIKNDAAPPTVIIRYEADMNSVETMDKINMVHRTYGSQLRDISYKRHDDGLVSVKLRIQAHSQHLKTFVESLGIAGATRIRTKMPWNYWNIGVTVLLVFLWGMDAVLTKYLLDEGVSPGAFTLLRSWSGVVFAIAAVVAVWESKTLLLIPISHPLLWLSGISFYFVNLLTNYTLTSVSPLFYKTSLRMTAVLLALPLMIGLRQSKRSILSIVLSLSGLWLLIQNSPSTQGTLLAISMVLMFVLYTKSSSLFQTNANISVRYLQFFLAISIISALVSPVVFLFDTVTWPSPILMLAVVLFTGMFVCVPYMLFYYLERAMGYDKLSPFFHLSILVTFIAQWLILGVFDGILLIPAAALIMASALTPKTQTTSNNPI